MTKPAEHWLRLSEYRVRSAKILHESGQHLDAVFNFQQAIEYMLKAVIFHQRNKNPPRTHDLLRLIAELSEPVPPTPLRILDELHDVSVPLRYPDDLDEALEAYTYEEVKRIGLETEELLQWLRQKMN